jgi:transcriptional regulator with PAS, ATPase and Fis domain
MHSLPLQINQVEPVEGMIGPSAALRHLREKIARVAAAPRTTVLVTGESGVGKEVVAKGIHARSERRDGPFIALNCAALTDGLLEAELFGHEPGAYTGAANKGREGLFAAANGGTLLLDEVGELAPELQAKLLRVLQERCYRRVGGNEDHSTDVRIIACTNRDLSQLVEEGRFREDLYYRLNVLVLRVSPLRERPDDIAPIALHLCDVIEREHGITTGGLSEASLATLAGHGWPGNVRELKNAIERAAVECAGATIEPEHLGITLASPAPAVDTKDDSELNLKRMEERLIRRALETTGGNRSRSARLLGVNRATLYNKLRAYQIA